ncbi:MAG TPA: hypothetical protein VNK82_07525 [Terriglobales bacterium]|nr:hypothetical protein [Terriglobales bacterium]
MRRILLASALLAALRLPLFAADVSCAPGRHEVVQDLWDGYRISLGPVADGEHAGQCRAIVVSATGTLVFEAYGTQAALERASQHDVNEDGAPDVVVSTTTQSSYSYHVLTLADPPRVVAQFTTSVPLHFEDRDGDGRIEIWARDFAFLRFDDLPAALTPQPLIIFRLKGETLHMVSQAFWPDYEQEIAQAKGRISRDVLEKFIGSPTAASDDDQKPKELSPHEKEAVTEVKAEALGIVLAYLYGGRGQEAWKALDEMWPPLDKPRIRQMILKARTAGILSEINRPKK